MAHPRDPSDGIDAELLPHVHLLSANQYPNQARLDLQNVTKYLMAAPSIAKDKAPFFWTYLDRPAPNTVLLVWQPLAKLGMRMASDGYIWAPEQFHRADVGNGLVMEIYFNRTGFRQGDQIAQFARRRFRLVPSSQGGSNPAQCDMNLWIVHYALAEANDQVPINLVPFTPEVQKELGERNYLQSCGTIARKDFHLSDRSSWPQIQWPRTAPPGRQAPYAPGQARRVPQQMAYPAAGPQGGRRRGQPPTAQHPGIEQLEDDERFKDVFDVLTPRDIALARYQQNHEWMETVLSSPYPLHQITPPDMGLGLKGSLQPLTEGIFTAPGGDAPVNYPQKPYSGKLDGGLAEEFKKRAREHIDTTTKEMEKMKEEHAKFMASLQQSSDLGKAERELRSCVESRGPEIWRLEGRTGGDNDDSGNTASTQFTSKKMDEIVAEIEARYGRMSALRPLNRLQDGGYQEPEPEPVKEPTPVPAQSAEGAAGSSNNKNNNDMSRRPSQTGSQNSGVMVDDADIDMGGTAAGLLDQMHTGFSATSTPVNNFPTPQANPSGANSGAPTPAANVNAPSPAPNQAAKPEQPKNESGQDVDMGNTDAGNGGTSEQAGTGDDWVMVPKDGVPQDSSAAPGSGAGSTPNVTGASAGSEPPKPASASASAAATPAPAPTAGSASTAPPQPGAAVAAAAGIGPKQGSAAATPAATEGDANDFSSLGDLDTAGEALASYGTPGLDGAAGSLGEGLDLNMEMEDSAFGDAFHGVGNNNGTPGGNQSEGA